MKSNLKKRSRAWIPSILLAWVTLLVATVSLPAQTSSDSSGRWPETGSPPTPDVQHADFAELPVRTADARQVSGHLTVDPNDPQDDSTARDERRTISPLGSGSGWIGPLRDNFKQIDFGRMIAALAIVLGAYFALIWAMRALAPASARRLPKEVVEILGAISLAPNQKLQVIRLGSKLLLIVQAPEGIQTVGEITDPVEAEYLTAVCQGREPRRFERPVRRPVTPPTTSAPANGNLRQILAQLENALGAETSPTQFEA